MVRCINDEMRVSKFGAERRLLLAAYMYVYGMGTAACVHDKQYWTMHSYSHLEEL